MTGEYIHQFDPIWEDWYIKDKIGAGSFGSVWTIVHSDTQKIEAVKEVLVPQTEDIWEDALLEGMEIHDVKEYFRKVLSQTLEETAIMKQLSGCDNIVHYTDEKVFDLSKAGGTGWAVYIRMEYLVPFKKLLMKQTFHLSDIRKLGIDLCEALKWCEKYHILHQDIKPDNIFYNPEQDKYKLGDFGISYNGDRETAKKKGKPGTLSYMSPEVYHGEEDGTALDRYALGMLLYRMLNHYRMPFLPPYPAPFSPLDRKKAMMQRLEGQIPPLPTWSVKKDPPEYGMAVDEDEVQLAEQLSQFAKKCIDPDPAKRFPDAGEMQKALETMQLT